MSDKEFEEPPPEKPFHVDRAKTGRANCKKCKQKITQGELRFAKLGYNPFGTGTIKQWHHIPCMFEVFKKQRATTKKLEHPDEIGGWDNISESDKLEIISYFTPEVKKVFENEKSASDIQGSSKNDFQNNTKNDSNVKNHKDNSFRMFRKICNDVANESSYLNKTKIIADFFDKGSDGDVFKGDMELWCRLLLPGVVQRVYKLQSQQLIKLFSKILGTNYEEMLEDLEKGDVAETVSDFFKSSKVVTEAKKSTLTLTEVDTFLDDLTKTSTENEKAHVFKEIIKKCTANDLKMLLRLIKHDLRINAGAKHILGAIHQDAYEAFQTSRDIKAVVKNALKTKTTCGSKSKQAKSGKGMKICIKMMTPVLPMLAQPCKSVQMALEKCPNGIFSEIKYDGERIQLHKSGNTFKYFNRSLKPTLAHKVNHFKEYIPKAFPFGEDLILDAEVLLVDITNGKPLPFGTLGIHKKNECKNANVCLFVFDCLYYNGESLLKKTLTERKNILKKNMVEIKHRVMFSEMEVIHQAEELEKMMTKVFKLGLEGLVLKDKHSTYEPGKRHWLKVKKDYLGDGSMADSADLVVLGAWFGTGSKGGIMSSFLMGCVDNSTKKWVTVTKVSNGHSDSTLERIQKELDVVKINKDPSKVPSWLNCSKKLTPDFVASDPKKMPVWEITGAEFTNYNETSNPVHTANGLSIRFPRVTRIRNDKDWSAATTLDELMQLYQKSKNTTDFSLDRSKSLSSQEDSKVEDLAETKRRKRKHDSQSGEESYCKKKKVSEIKNDDEYDTETDEDEVKNQEKKLNFANPLPDIFTKCVIYLPEEFKDRKLLRRYLIAYNATIYDSERNNAVENSKDKVSHVVHLKKVGEVLKEDFWSKNVRHVHVNWVWDSIKLLEKQPETRYTITALTGT